MAKDDIKVTFIRRPPRAVKVELPKEEKIRRPPPSRTTMNA